MPRLKNILKTLTLIKTIQKFGIDGFKRNISFKHNYSIAPKYMLAIY